jgi:Tfp pilus assembly protein PilF
MTKILNFYVRGLMFLLPVMMMPVMVDGIGMGRNWLMMAMVAVGILVWVMEMLINKKVEIKTNKVLILLGALVIWAWIGRGWKMTVGLKMKSVMDIGGVGTLTAVWGWLFLVLQTASKEERKEQLNWLTAASILVAISSLVVFLLPSAKLPIVWPKDNPMVSIGAGWSLTGALLSEVMLMVFLVMEWGKRLFKKLSAQQNDNYVVEAVITFVTTLALMLDIFRIYKLGWINLDGTSAWIIAVETFKRSPIWGMGAGNFSEAFSEFRPNSYNLTQYWMNGFKTSSMGVLQLWTELGGVGLLIGGGIVSGMLALKKNYSFVRVAIMGLMVAFLPFNVVAVVLWGWLAMGLMESKKNKLAFKVGENGFNIAPWVMAVVVVAAMTFSGYWLYRILMGDILMRQSLVAAAKNDGGTTYNLQIKAIGMNPTAAEYRKVYSQTNLALALSLLTNKEITDDDKQKASVLIQQSVREAKSAIALEERNPTYWLNLASIYRQIVGIVDGAPDWSFQAYQQAVALEPSNPMSKLEMGGLLYAANRWEEADRVFEQAVVTKNDFANGWYNWAYTAKKLNKLQEAVTRLNQALMLVPVSSGDYEKASKELATWKKELDDLTKKQGASAEATAPKPETLKTPEPLPTGSKEEKVNVSTDELMPPTTNSGQVTPAKVEATTTPTGTVNSGQ